MTIGEKRPCASCNREVEIVNELMEGNVVHQTMSCGHTSDKTIINIQEYMHLKEMLQSDVIKVQTVAREVPVRLTGEFSGVSQLASFSGFQGTINSIGQLSINNLNINYSSQNIETRTTTITTVNNIEEIFSEIDKSSSSPEDKEKMKGTFSNMYNELKSLGAMAAPYVPMFQTLLNMFIKGSPS